MITCSAHSSLCGPRYSQAAYPSTGVPIVHLITHPFPHAWHTLEDNGDIIDRDMVENFRKILTVFLHEYFGL